MFKEYYRRRFQEILDAPLQPSDGFGDTVVQAKLAECRLTLPTALIDYYALAGQHPINTEHHQLLPIEQINCVDDKFIFMEENQRLVYWAIDQVDIFSSNPIVWQGTSDSITNWYEEEYKLNQFLMATWKWIMTGEQEDPE